MKTLTLFLERSRRANVVAVLLGLATLASGPRAAVAADVIKANNTTTLNQGGSWVGGTAPGASDVGVWDSTLTAANTVDLGGNLSWSGIRIANPAGGVTIRFATAQTLTLGSAGIDMSAATQNLSLMSAAVANTAGTLAIGAAQTWNVASGRTLTLFSTSNSANQRLSGSGNIEVTGGGLVNMNVGDLGSTTFEANNGNDTYTGNWTIKGGSKVISLRNGTHAWGRGSITLDNGTISQTQGNWSWSNNIAIAAGGGTIFSDSSGNNRYMNLTGVISGSGTLAFNAIAAMTTQEGFILTGTNTFTGPMTINANATVRIGGDATTTTNSNAAGTLGSIPASVAITNNGILGFGWTNAQTFANAISGSGVVRLGRPGGVLPSSQIVTLSGASTYTGATQVNAGRLNLTGSLASAITVASGANISGTGSTTGLLTLSSGGGLVLAGGATTTSLTANGASFGGSNVVTFLSDATPSTVYDVFTYGSGAVTNISNLSVAWRGTLSDDTVNQKYIFTAGAVGTRTWNTTSGTWQVGAVGSWSGGDGIFYNGDTADFNEPSGPSTVTLSGRLAPAAVNVNNTTNTYTFSGTDGTADITGSATLTKTGSGTLIITSAQTNSGATTVNGGTLNVGNGGTTGALGVGAISVGSGATLVLSRSNAFTVSNVISGAGTVTKAGAGRMTVNGNNSGGIVNWSFTGTGNGDIGFSNANAVGGSGSTITLADNATGSAFFSTSGNTSGVGIAIGSNAVLTWNGSSANTNTLSGVVSGAGGLTKVSGETLILTGANTYSGPTTVTTGVLQVGGSGVLGSGNYAAAVTLGATLFVNTTANQSLGGTISGGGRLDKSNTGTLTLSGTNTYSGGTEVLGGTLQASALAGIGSGYLAVKNGATFAYTGAASETTTRNLFLDIGASRIDVTLATGSLTWNDSALKDEAFTKGGAGSLAIGGAFSGAASVTVIDGGLSLTGVSTYTGTTTVSGGTLTITSTGRLYGTGAFFGDNDTTYVSIASGGTLATRNWGYGSGGALSELRNNYYAVSVDGGTVRFTESSDSLRAFQVGAGGATLSVDSGATYTKGAGTTAGGNVIRFTANSTLTVTGAGDAVIADSLAPASYGNTGFSIAKTGTGRLTLSGNNLYTGTTTVSGGTLLVNGSLAAGSAVTVQAAGTLGGSGTINGPATIFGTHSPGNSPGVQTFGGNLGYDGATVIWELTVNTVTQTTPAVFDQVVVGGNLDFTSPTSLSLVFNQGSTVNWTDAFWDEDREWLLYDVTGTTSNIGSFSINIQDWLDASANPLSTARPQASFSLRQAEGSGDVYIGYAVPEPGTLALVAAGLGLASWAVRRRRSRACDRG